MFPSRPLAYAQRHRRKFVEELKNFVRFPSVSAHPGRGDDLKRCAAWLANHLRLIGIQQVRIVPIQGHPVVYAEWLHEPRLPTVLIYGHYDVQPAEPLHEWHSPPFEPIVRGDNLYGRGACDDKGQMFAHVKAIESYLKIERRLPVNIKCLFEGEEEIGSPNLAPFVSRNAGGLTADTVIMSDTLMLEPNRPAVTYALRGGLSLELDVRGPQSDLHSGNFGGAVHNPLQALCEMIAKFHDSEHRIAVPGFYDRVRLWPQEERRYMARTGPANEQILKNAKTRTLWGESGFSLYERTTTRPSLSISGVVGGYQGPGVKAVIPSRALAKLNFRLVPDQRPDEIEQLVRQYVAHIAPSTVEYTIRTFLKARSAVIDRRHPALSAASIAYQRSFGVSPVFLRSGGTIPIVSTFQELLGIPTVLMGFALPDDQIHAPNEKFHLPTFHKGIATCIHFLEEFGAGRSVQLHSVANLADRVNAAV